MYPLVQINACTESEDTKNSKKNLMILMLVFFMLASKQKFKIISRHDMSINQDHDLMVGGVARAHEEKFRTIFTILH